MSNKLFHKAFSNRSIIHPGDGGISTNNEQNEETIKKLKAINDFLKKYQTVYKNAEYLIPIPSSIAPYIKMLRKIFNIKCDNISNMMKYLNDKMLNRDIKKHSNRNSNSTNQNKSVPHMSVRRLQLLSNEEKIGIVKWLDKKGLLTVRSIELLHINAKYLHKNVVDSIEEVNPFTISKLTDDDILLLGMKKHTNETHLKQEK